MRRILLAALATAIAIAGTYAVRNGTPPGDVNLTESNQALTETTPSPQIPLAPRSDSPTPAPATGAALANPVPDELNRLINVFGRRSVASTDPLDFRTLGGHYATRARLTGDIADHEAAVAAYRQAYSLAPSNRAGRLGYAAAAASVHNFTVALDVAELALAADEADADALVIAADAAIELGDLPSAVEYLDRLEAAAPGHPAVLARLANLAHLTGDQTKAIALAEAAEAAAREFGFSAKAMAFYPLLRSDLLLDAGRYDDARKAVDSAIAIDAGYAVSHASLGRVLVHQGEHEAAIDAYQYAASLQSDPGWEVAIGELLLAGNLPEQARPYLDGAIEQLARADEVVFGRVLANLYSDLDIEPAEALRLARADIERRKDIHAYDTLAWALLRNGMVQEAVAASATATSTGAMDAGLLYHSALIANAAGDYQRAIRELTSLLATNPGFHPLQSVHAAELLAELTG